MSCYSQPAFIKARQLKAEDEIARTIIECNLSFHVLRTKQWKRMVKAIVEVGPSDNWTGLDYEKMRTTKLESQKIQVEQNLAHVKECWAQYGCTLISDGWSDVRRRHIINILVSSCKGTYFLKAIEAGKAGTRITAEFIFEHIKEAIMEVGPKNVVQVVTDNASNCKRMGELVEEEFPGIVWTPCATHCVDLLMEDIGKLTWVKHVVAEAVRITTFFRKKHQALAIFRAHSQIDIVRPSKTRFAYMYLVLHRLLEVRDSLRAVVVSSNWREMRDSSNEQTRYIQRKLLDEDFWIEVEGLVKILKPMYVFIRFADMDGCTLGLLYHHFQKMKELVASTNSPTLNDMRREEIMSKIDERWEFMKRPIHGVAALLHPYYFSMDLQSNEKLNDLKDQYLSKTLNFEDSIVFERELVRYWRRSGIAFTKLTTSHTEFTSKPLTWWQIHGYQVGNVQKIAFRVLSQNCSASACERNWSAFSLIHTKIRNRLSSKQLEKLIFCRTNLRLLRSIRAEVDIKEVDPSTFDNLIAANTFETEDQIRNEQEEIYRQLHRELEEVDRRLSRTRPRTRSTSYNDDAIASHGGRTYTRRARGHGRGRIRLEEAIGGEEEEDFDYIRPLREPNYDSDGNSVMDNEEYDESSSGLDD